MNKIQRVEITPKTILTTFLIICLIWFVIKLYSVLVLVFIAFSIAAMLSPVVEYLHKRKVPKTLSIAIIYIIFLSFVVLLILVSYKPLITQIEAFTKALPDIIINVVNFIVERIPPIRDTFNWDEISENIKNTFWDNIQVTSLSEYIISGLGKAFGLVGSFFSALVSIFSTIVLSIYFIQFKEPSKEKFVKLLPSKYQKRIFKLINKVEEQLGAWLRAQILLMLIIGILAWSGLEFIGMEFSIPLGIVAGLLEVVPGIGPMITWVLAITVGIGSGLPTWQMIFIAIWFILIQQLENYIIIPKIMQKFMGTNPVLTIIAILGASKIFGIWGTLLAVPAIAIFQISLRYYLEYKKSE
ncbi:AI-2E family transporter [Patescibacteria group bacterium]